MIQPILKKMNSNKTYLLVFLLAVLGLTSVVAQQDAQYTQYMYNTVSVNPGYAGSRGNVSVAALHRSQWLGLEGAPTTQTLNVHSPIGYKGVGLGLSIVNDKIGPTSETSFDLDFSYTIRTSRDARLSFGLKGSANLLDVNYSQLDEYSEDGSLYNQDIQNRLSPNIGVGVYYHTQKFYAGLSVPRFLETEHFDSSSLSTAKEQMNFYFITGYVWDLNPYLKFKPTLLTKIVRGAPLQVDLSANFLMNDKFVLGGAYRWDAAFSGLAGFFVSDEMFLGLAYDREVTELGKATFNSGSFEVLIRYDFIRRLSNMKSPRFF